MRRIICAFFIQWIFINFCLGEKKYQDLSLPDEIYTHEEVDTALDTQIKVPSGPLNINEVWLHEKGLEIYNAISARKNRSRRGVPGGKAEQDVDGQKNGTTTGVPGGVVKQDVGSEKNGATRGVPGDKLEQDVDGQTNVTTTGVTDGEVKQEVDGRQDWTTRGLPDSKVEQDVDGNKNGNTKGIPGGKVEQDVDGQINGTTTGVTNGEVEQGVNDRKNGTSRGVPGGEVEQDVHDPMYKELALESFNKYRQSHELPNFQAKAINVTRVTTEVVAGVIYRINFDVLPTEGATLPCHSKVMEPLQQSKTIEVNCGVLGTGSEKEQNVHDPKYKKLAVEFFGKWRESYLPRDYHIKEINVTRVTTQVVAGLITRIHFNVLPTEGAAFLCYFKDLVQTWPQKMEFEINCEDRQK